MDITIACISIFGTWQNFKGMNIHVFNFTDNAFEHLHWTWAHGSSQATFKRVDGPAHQNVAP